MPKKPQRPEVPALSAAMGRRAAYLRHLAGLTQRELGREVGLTGSGVSIFEQGRLCCVNVRLLDRLIAIARGAGLTAGFVLAMDEADALASVEKGLNGVPGAVESLHQAVTGCPFLRRARSARRESAGICDESSLLAFGRAFEPSPDQAAGPAGGGPSRQTNGTAGGPDAPGGTEPPAADGRHV